MFELVAYFVLIRFCSVFKRPPFNLPQPFFDTDSDIIITDAILGTTFFGTQYPAHFDRCAFTRSVVAAI